MYSRMSSEISITKGSKRKKIKFITRVNAKKKVDNCDLTYRQRSFHPSFTRLLIILRDGRSVQWKQIQLISVRED